MPQYTAMTEQEEKEVEEIFLNLLEKETAYYHVILDLSRTEFERLETRCPFSGIQKLLKKKKIILACIEEIEVSLLPLKKYWIQNKKSKSETAEKIKLQFKVLGSTVKEILSQDKKNQGALEKYLLAVRKSDLTQKSDSIGVGKYYKNDFYLDKK